MQIAIHGVSLLIFWIVKWFRSLAKHLAYNPVPALMIGL